MEMRMPRKILFLVINLIFFSRLALSVDLNEENTQLTDVQKMNILKDLIKIGELKKQLQHIELNHKLDEFSNENDDETEMNIEKTDMNENEENDDINQFDQDKRSQAFLRFGKRSPAYLRFGRSQAFLRFGKRTPYLRFGKRSPAYLRFGRSVSSNEHSTESEH